MGANILATSGPQYLGQKARKIFEVEREKADHISYGGDGYLFGLLASSRISTIVEDSLAWHDIAACVPVILGAGGEIVDFSGCCIKPGQEQYAVLARRKS